MKTKFKKILAKDGLELHGLHFMPDEKSNKAIIHIHGLSGNFYENQFLVNMAEEYTNMGIHFLVFNNRGHDYISDNVQITNKHREFVNGGGAYEVFSECAFDVMGVYDYMQSCEIVYFCLQGHSMGCNKTIYSIYKHKEYFDNLCGIILLSPCDGIGLMEHNYGKSFSQSLEQAKKLLEQGKKDVFVNQEAGLPLMSAFTYVDHYKVNGDHDIFPYRDPQADFKAVRSIEVPIFVGIGSEDEYIVDSTQSTIDILKANTTSPNFGSTVISGASHDYAGHEQKLIEEIINWLKNIF